MMVKKVSKTKRCKVDKLLMVFCGLVILIIVIAIVLHVKNENKISNAQNGMSEYLKNKYKEDFKVERPEHKHGGFGVNGIWMSQAYLVSNPKLKFDIDCSYLNLSDCSDQYIAAIWSVQASKELESIVKEVNASSSNGYKADSARAEVILSGSLVDSVNKQSKYEENKTKDEGFLYRLIIDAPNDSQKTSYIFKIVEKLREEGIYSIKIDTNSKNRSTGRCTIFLDKKDLGSENSLDNCINKTGE
jgi:hypothetical protein